MRKRVIFYSSVKSKSLFNTQMFYQIDIDILKRMGYEVVLSNNLLDAFKFWQYDLVFAYFFRYSFIFAFIATLFGKRIYITGGIDDLDKEYAGDKAYRIQKTLFKLCYFFSDKCIIVSKADLDHVKEILGENTDKLAYSEHTIDTSNFTTDDSTHKNNDFCTIGWMGHKGNVYRKGIDKALLLFALLKNKPEYAHSKFYIMGRKGEGTIILESLIKRFKLEESVILTGEVSEQKKISILKRSKFYIQLSSYEGFGVACLEALIAGDIIIHSGKGGLSNPIYKNHIQVDINYDIEEQIQSVYERIVNLNMSIIKSNANSCLVYYDNDRRLNDFEIIIGRCN